MFASGKTAAVSSVANYIEDVFSTYLYTGNDSSQTITNNIDLSGEGGLTWIKVRGSAANHVLFDTSRTQEYSLSTNTTAAQINYVGDGVSQWNNNGFVVRGSATVTNANNSNYVSWTFRKAEKFFDVVTYTGTGTAQNITHNLGSTPGCIIIKRTNGTQNWWVYHRSLDATSPDDYYITLNLTDARTASGALWNSTQPTSSVFTVDSSANISGATYVAYLFAHDAGGFGDDGSDNVITCGSFSYSSGFTNYSLGYEPQWVLVKRTDSTGSWYLTDIMRGASNDANNDNQLVPNTSAAETASLSCYPTATGFTIEGLPSGTYIYIAIRRGPMKTPEAGTEVFSPVAYTGNGATTQTITSPGFPVDFTFNLNRGTIDNKSSFARLRGTSDLMTNKTDAENPGVAPNYFDRTNLGIFLGNSSTINNNGDTYVVECFRRAPGFFDVVCYTGTGSARTVTHNLGVAPELMIIKNRSRALGSNWAVYSATLGNTKTLQLNLTNAESTDANQWNNTSPTSSVFTVGTNAGVNENTGTLVAYLFASVTGVSKVGSYTGNGSNQTINCGFTAGARFILIKRTDSTGDWYVYDSARGIVSGNDPYLLLNSTAAEVTNTDYIDTYSSGFEISSTAPAAINANGGTFIFLAIA